MRALAWHKYSALKEARLPSSPGTMPRFKAHLRDGRRKLADVEVDVRQLSCSAWERHTACARRQLLFVSDTLCNTWRDAGVTGRAQAGGGEDQEAFGVRRTYVALARSAISLSEPCVQPL